MQASFGTLLLASVLSSPSFAQEPAQAEAAPAPNEPQEIPSFTDPRALPGFLGASRSGFLTRFDNAWNPAIGVVIDALVEVADVADSSRYNSARIRSGELDFASRLDPLGWAYVVGSFVDTGEESEVELEEAAVWLDRLPNNFSLRGGRFLADFGKWNIFHTHDKPFVNEDGVRTEYFGGPLFLSGAELHHWFGAGDVPVRWSVGLASAAEGDSHDAGGHAHEEVPFVGRRGIDNWAGSARLTAQHDAGQNGYFQWGLSGFYTPGAVELEEVTRPNGSSFVERSELRKGVLAADLTFRTVDASERTSETASVELWHDQSEFHNDLDQLRSGGHNGLWGFYEHAFSPFWAAGAVGSWFEHAESEDSVSLLGGGEAGASRGAFLTWHLSEFNRLRFQVLHTNPGFGEEKFWSFAIQWAALLGSHAHPIDW